jgi:hypothetical protein
MQLYQARPAIDAPETTKATNERGLRTSAGAFCAALSSQSLLHATGR